MSTGLDSRPSLLGLGNAYQERSYGNRDQLPPSCVHLPNRHRALLPPEPDATKQNHAQSRGLEDRRQWLAKDEVTEDWTWVLAVLEAVELRDHYSRY